MMMMMRIAIGGMLLAAALFAGCIFQNSPLSPNQPPTIQSFAPQTTFFSLTAPDSCVFSLRAADPDGDQIACTFAIGDSLLGAGESVKFYAVRPGQYVIRGEVRDGTTETYHEWHVTVLEKNNEPPVISWFAPEQARVACALGETLEFHFKANDDHPASLQFSYLLDGALLHSGSPDLINRFMQRGDFLLQGVVWDGQYGDTTSWDVSVTGFPDTIPPAPVLDLTGGPGDVDGSVWLEWTAPGDDGSEGQAASYVVKTSVYPILTEDDWMQAEGKPGEPVPSAAGTRERMVIRNLVSASYVYITMRGMDDFFNLSPIGNCVKLLVRGVDIVGQAIDGVTGAPVPGIVVTASVRADTTGENGTYFLANVPSYVSGVMARDEKVYGALGDYFDCSCAVTAVAQTIHMDFYMIPAFTLVSAIAPDPYEGRFLAFFKEITKTDGYLGRSTVYKGWNHWPIVVCNPPMVYDGVDLQAACTEALDDWEQSTGIDLFTEVSSEAGADVVVKYDTATVDRHHVVTAGYNADGTPSKKEVWIYTKDAEVPFWRYGHLIFAHEFGHVIGLDHSRNPGHLMVGLTTPRTEHPTTDEVRVVQVLLRLPNFFDYKQILED
jgi:hypothetical protein